MRITGAAALALVLAGCGGAAENKAGNGAATSANGSAGNSTGAATNGTGAVPATVNSAGGTSSAAANVTVPGGLPLFEGATEVTQSGNKVSFNAPVSWSDVHLFYIRAAEQAGYTVTNSQVGSSALVTLKRGSETILIKGSVILGGRSAVEIWPEA